MCVVMTSMHAVHSNTTHSTESLRLRRDNLLLSQMKYNQHGTYVAGRQESSHGGCNNMLSGQQTRGPQTDVSQPDTTAR